jgi:hypothetical protein
VRHDTVDWRETFSIGSNEVDWRPEVPGERYDLATALRIVRRMETSAGRGAVFEEIKAKNPLYRLVDAAYSVAGVLALQPLVLLVYMLKCMVSAGATADDGAEAVAIANFDNEHHTVDRVAALVPDVCLLRMTIERGHALSLGQWAAALRMLGSAGRAWQFLRMLARTHSFMPAARIASALAFYMRFSRLFAERPGLNAAIVASNYSPEAVGMAAAAHRAGKRVVYANHAPVPANAAVVPPVLADCALFYGLAIRQTYEQRSRCTAEVALIGLPSPSRAMEWPDEVRTVGIFLTSGTRAEAIADLVAAIRADRPGVRILIRHHPVALLKTDLSGLGAGDPNLEITIGNPLDAEIAACDLVVCGNSGVAMNVLSGGRPVAYLASLDGIMFDCNGFVSSGLVCPIAGWSADTYAELKRFYFNPKWHSVMRTYDASYGVDAAALREAAAETVRRHLRRARDPASGPAQAPPAEAQADAAAELPLRLRA